MPLYLVVCRHCRKAEEHYLPLSAYRGDNRVTCPDCGQLAFRPPRVGQGIYMGGEASVTGIYPRWDRGLGTYVRNHQHRQQIMDERGLVEMPPDLDVDRVLYEQSAEQREMQAIYDDYVDRMDNSPEFANARELRDKGHPDYQWTDGI